MSGGGRILEQDDPFSDLVPAKPQDAADPFHDLVPQSAKDPFQDLVPQPKRKPVTIPRPPIAATDATRVGPEPVGLEEQLRNEHPDLLTATVQGVAGMVEHPIETAVTLAKTPFEGGKAVGEYVEGGRLHPGKGRAAAIGAAQTAAMLLTGPGERLAEPVVEAAIGARLAPFATRTAIGAASGATFTPDRPAVGAILGGLGGAASSRGVAAAKLQERIARFEQMAKEHPDWVDHTDRGSTPAEAETRKSHTLANPNGPKATATAEAMASDSEPDFVVEDPVHELGPFKGALVEHGKQFVDAVENPAPPPAPVPEVEQLRQQESDLFNQQIEANRAAGWPAPTEDALDHFGDGALEISHEETARELWMHASDHYTASEAIAQGVTGRKRDELERVARQADDAYNGMLSQYEDYFGPEGVQTFLQKTGLPGDLTGGIESIPDARDFNDRISTGEPPTRANPDGVAGLVEKVSRDTPAAPAAAPAATPAPQPPKKLEAAVKSPFGVVVSVPGKSLQLDPDRFQFKHQGIDAKSGAAAWVKGAKRYNPVLGGVWVTWIDPANGVEYVVNSHHRKAIYDNDITPDRPENVNVLRIEAADAQEARAIGARINIAEGHGTALDVAQFIRDSGLQSSDLEKEGISLRGDLARQGSALAQLTPDLLAKVGTGELAENHGVAIGEMLAGKPELQREVVAEVKRSGRRLSADDVREVARQVDAAGTADVRQETLFGGEVGRRPLFIERAQLATSIMKKLGQDRRILGFVAQEQRAQVLAKGGNVIDVEKSRELADQSGQLEELFERLYTREGPIAKVLTQAASRVAHGQKVRVVADDIYADVAAAVQEEISRGTGSGASDRDAEGSGSVSPGAAETGDVKPEEIYIDPDQEGFGISEPGPLHSARLRFDESTWDYLPTKDKQQLIESLGFHRLTAEEQAVKPWKQLQAAVKDAVRPDMHALLERMYKGRLVREPMRPEYQASYDKFLAKRKAAYLEHFRETKSVGESATAAGVHPSSVAQWRSKDPEFAAAVDAIAPTRKGKLRAAPKSVPVSTRIKAGDLKDLVKQLRERVIAAGGLLEPEQLHAFNEEAAAIVKRLGEKPSEAKKELADLADDFSPIEGLADEMDFLHDEYRKTPAELHRDRSRRYYARKRGETGDHLKLRKPGNAIGTRHRNVDQSPEAQAHRDRQDRYTARKRGETGDHLKLRNGKLARETPAPIAPAPVAAAPTEPVNSYIEIYRAAKAAKAAREARVGESRVEEEKKNPYQTDLFVGNAESVKPELRSQKPKKEWPFFQLTVRKTFTPHTTLWGGAFEGKIVTFSVQPKPADFGKEKLNYIELTLESGDLKETELEQLAQLAQLQDKREVRYRRRGELRGAMRSVEVHEPKFDYASTQVNLPSKAAAAIKAFGAKIPDADLAENGREEDPHITVKYGLHGTDPDAVRKLLEDVAPFTVNLEATSYFPNGESGNGDVLKVDVDSPALHALNKKIADALPNTETHPTYKPHATIAYLKPGLGKKYSGNGTFMGRSVRVTSVVFSDRNGEQTRIKLGGKEPPQVVIFDRHGFLESKTAHEIDTIGLGHHSQTFSKKALNIQDQGVLAYMNRDGNVTVNVAADAGVSDKRIRDVVKEHWPHTIGKDVTIIRQNAGIQESSLVEDLRVWEKDMFGYDAGPESLFDEDAGKAGPPKPTEGGFETKAKEAREHAAFLKKQLARMQHSLDTFNHSASANNRPANDLARKISALRNEIADLERIANFAEKLKTEEIELRTDDEAPADDDSIDMFKEREGKSIGPSNHTRRIQTLERDLDNYANGIHPHGSEARMLAAKDFPEHMRGAYSGIKGGLDRVTKELRELLPETERAGYPSEKFIKLFGEFRELVAEYDHMVADAFRPNFPEPLEDSQIDRVVRHFPGDGMTWNDTPRNPYEQALQDWWTEQSKNSRLALLKKWTTFYSHWSIGGKPDFSERYAFVDDARKLPDHVQRAAVTERMIQLDAIRSDLNVWEDPSQLHMFYTYGSVEAFQAAAKEVLEESGKFVTIAQAQAQGQQVLSTRQRRRNVEMAKQTGAFVDIVGKQIRGPHDIAQLLFPFRSPEMERFSVILTDDSGKVLAHTMETSGAINYSVVPEKLAKIVARRARVVGATRVHFGHNHPSGDPTPSTEDKRMTMEFAYQLQRRGVTLVDHVVINHKTYAWIKPDKVAKKGKAVMTVGNKLPYDVPALADRSDWTQGHGGIIKAPIEVAGLSATALQGSDFGVLYLSSQGHALALEPRPKGDLETVQKWIRDALKAHAADRVAIVYNPAEHGDYVDAFKDKLENFPSLAHHVFDVVPFDGSKSLQEDAPHLLVHALANSPLLPQASKRLIGEGRKGGYGGRTDGPEGEDRDRSEAPDANDRRAEASPVPAEEGNGDRGSSTPAELHDPQLERAGGFLAKLGYEVRRILTPAALTRESAQTARVLRAASGRMAHRRELASHALRQFSREITRLSPEKRFAFMHQIETGEKVTTTPGMTAAAAQLRAELDRVRDRVRGLGTGKLENFIENYLPHIYKDPKRARTLIQQMMQRRPLEGNKSWLKKRSIPTLKDAMEIGLEPITDNPIDLALLRIFQMNKYVMAHEILQELKAKGPEFLKFVGAHEKPPIGYRPIDDSAFTVFGRPAVPVQEAFDPVLRGHLEQILNRLGGKHQRTVKMSGQRWGEASGTNVRTKFGGDIGVLMHEIGHVLDTKFELWDKLHEPIESRTVTRGKKKGQSVPTKDAIAYRVKIDKELRELADLRMEGQNPDDVAEHHKKYIRNRAEKIANAIHALVYMPDRMGGVAPTVKAALEQLLQGTPAADILNPKRGVALGTGVAEKGIYGTLITGKYYAPDAVATVINNFLSPGLRGNPIYDAYMGVGNSLNQVQLGLSFFHLGFTSLDAMVSKLALAMQQTARGQLLDAAKSTALFPFAAFTNFAQGFQVYRAYLDPERAGKYDQVIAAIERAGGKIKMDDFYRNDHGKKLIEGIVHRDPITVVARLPLAAFELSSKFILEFVVPRQKLGVFADMFMMEAKRLGPDATEDELRRAAQRAWDSTDNRMGQMVYDNLMWHRVLKDTLMGLVRAVGWDLGTFRELLGGGRDLATLPVKTVRRLSDRRQKLLPRAEGDEQHQDRPDPLFTHKAAYVLALFAGVGALGAALNKGMTGEWPEDQRDLWTPRTGKTNDEGNPERVELPSYVKDVFSYLGHGVQGTVQTALHKLHPMLNYVVSVIQNEDYYGNMIRNPDDDGFTQFQQEMKYAIEQWQPFGFRNAQEQAKRNQSKAVQIGNFVGITPAHRSDTRTPAGNKLAELLRKKGRSGLTPEESEERQLAGELRTAKKLRKPKGTAIAEAMRGRQTYADKVVGLGPTSLSHRDAERIWMGTGRNTQLEQFKRLDYPEAKQVMDLASPEERRRWHSVFVQKRANYSAEHGAAAMRAVK